MLRELVCTYWLKSCKNRAFASAEIIREHKVAQTEMNGHQDVIFFLPEGLFKLTANINDEENSNNKQNPLLCAQTSVAEKRILKPESINSPKGENNSRTA